MKMHNLEIRREIFHILVGILFILTVLFIPYGEIILFIVFILGIMASLLSTRIKLPIIHNLLCTFERKCNKNFPGKGVIYFFLGSLLALRLFDQNIALASIAILTFADPISNFVGSSFGIIKLASERKNIEGTFAGVVSGTIFASFFVNPLLAFTASLVAMVFELVGIKLAEAEIDDNLLIPLVAGTTIFLITKFLPI
jgi:dolichol kinase